MFLQLVLLEFAMNHAVEGKVEPLAKQIHEASVPLMLEEIRKHDRTHHPQSRRLGMDDTTLLRHYALMINEELALEDEPESENVDYNSIIAMINGMSNLNIS